MDRGGKLPVELSGQVIYYVGPSPARPDRPIGSAGPTTSYRMDAYATRLMEKGIKGMIGKGKRSPVVVEAMKKYRCVYFAAVGGAGALLARRITASEIVAYEELGPEAIRKLTVKDFPVIVINDIFGGDAYIMGVDRFKT
jgi:fumarate hydratase subunit beta